MTNYLWENIFRKNKDENSILLKLKQNILFQDLSSSELKMVEQIVHTRNYRAGEVVFRQGELGVGMYIIVRGEVNIYVEEIQPQTGESRSNLITQLKEDDFLGDLALIEDNSRRSATAIAQDDSVLIGFFKPDLIEITKRNPVAGVKILFRLSEVLGGRLRETTAKITELRKGLKK